MKWWYSPSVCCLYCVNMVNHIIWIYHRKLSRMYLHNTQSASTLLKYESQLQQNGKPTHLSLGLIFRYPWEFNTKISPINQCSAINLQSHFLCNFSLWGSCTLSLYKVVVSLWQKSVNIKQDERLETTETDWCWNDPISFYILATTV